MRTKASWLCEIFVLVALGLAFAGAPLAQTTTAVNVRNFEVISVDGNKLVFRDERGTNELTVPSDFRFTVDGKQMSVSELKPGMKGTATITTATTIKPVVVTEVREGVVLKAGPSSITVLDKEGLRKRFTQDQLDQRDIQILKDGRVMRIGELKEGDVLTATIVTQVAPVVVTEKEVQATLDKSAAEPAKVASTAAPGQPTPAASPQPSASPQPTAAPPAAQPAEQSGLGMTWYLVIAVLVAVALFFFMRRRKES
jgi:hypothetical protein